MGSGQHGPTAEFLAVIGSDGLGQAPRTRQLLREANQLVSSQCTLRQDGHCFMGCVIHYRKALDAAPFSCAIKHEDYRPHLISRCRPLQWMSICQGDFLAPVLLQLKASLGLQAIHTFLID